MTFFCQQNNLTTWLRLVHTRGCAVVYFYAWYSCCFVQWLRHVHDDGHETFCELIPPVCLLHCADCGAT